MDLISSSNNKNNKKNIQRKKEEMNNTSETKIENINELPFSLAIKLD